MVNLPLYRQYLFDQRDKIKEKQLTVNFLDPSIYLFPFLNVVGISCFLTVLSLVDLIFFVIRQ